MSKLVQSSTANFVRNEYRAITLQDPITTNAILGKNNIGHSNISNFAPEELAKILGVEFVIYGMLSITNKGASTYGGARTSYKAKDSGNSTKGNIFTSSSSTTTIDYDTTVDFRMFNDRGVNLYAQSRHVFGTNMDA
ncbi:hypothetical protein [Algoriphagus jejuensis]